VLNDLLSAVALLTRLPVGGLLRGQGAPDLARSVWAFPLIGLAVGGVSGLAYWAGSRLGMPPLLASAWTLGVGLLLTGAFHEDGLADVADGFGGGPTVERKLEIMRDSRIGSYGALALAWSAIVRVAAVSAIGAPRQVLVALVVTALVGRGAMIGPLLMLRPARPDGLAASMKRVPGGAATLGLGLSLIAPFLLLPFETAVAALGAAVVAVLGASGLARWQIGGHTGDVLGATEIAVECTVLTMLASFPG
jgi:adenosylcobinamide-GDP ribazoletransferase